ncbi:NAD(P)/FAD-dependent oxidoreductase [Pokkaliibacter plantistimulans]|uniref:FAD/NAD(P)-dependent oxidoreductase n=1 Tax=Pokkaliibacter plantistimulans TaxID=1635171 RepID=UPI000D746FC1|nr:FAD-dependent oxidoreductase [Pokkaliibacter plantistimulans]
MASSRILIVGAGPAGVRCAETLVRHGLRPTLIDENRRDGGQIYRRQPEGFQRDYRTLYGSEADKAKALHDSFDQLRPELDYYSDTSAWHLSGQRLYAHQQGRPLELDYDHLLLCTGATDRVMPVKGWQLAGTYSLGGAQIALKNQAVSIGHEVVFMGSGPLLYLVASQYLKAGANVAAVLDTSAFSKRLSALPKLLSRAPLTARGSLLLADLLRHGVSLHFGIRPLEVLGSTDSGVSAIRFARADGSVSEICCDALALGYHLRPETQLADLAGCAFQFDELSRQWLLQLDDLGRTSVPQVYAAGDGARIRGADAAERAGELAAIALLQDLNRATPELAARQQQLHSELAVLSRFAQGLSEAFPWPAQHAAQLSDDTIICRCEMISAGELRRTVQAKGALEVNRAKAFSRVGMGRCQGRYCAHVGAEVIAAASGEPLQVVGRQRGQAPVKPLPISLYAVEPTDPAPQESMQQPAPEVLS